MARELASSAAGYANISPQLFSINFQKYLSKFENAFVSIFNCICLNYEMYLSMRECAARELASSAADHGNTSSHFFNHI